MHSVSVKVLMFYEYFTRRVWWVISLTCVRLE